MSELAVIPTPPSQRFREFRIRFLPPIVFLCTLAAIFTVWREYVSPPTLVGQVEPLVAEVTSRNAGVVTNLFVKRFQEVRAGEVVAAVRVTDRRRYETEFELLRSQIALAQLELGTMADRQRLSLDYESLRVDYMRQQTDLQVAKAQLPHAEFDVDMSRRLLENKTTSEFEYHYFLSAYDTLNAQIEQLTKNVEILEQRLLATRELAETSVTSEASKQLLERLAALQDQQRALELLETRPMMIEAPIDGVVMQVHRQPGENVMAGDPILTITSKSSERISGYLHPPFAVDPKPGMIVQVRSRGVPRVEAEARVSGVGAGLEVITNIVFIRPNGPAELGLPVAISIPPSLKDQLRPGELIDVSFLKP